MLLKLLVADVDRLVATTADVVVVVVALLFAAVVAAGVGVTQLLGGGVVGVVVSDNGDMTYAIGNPKKS